MLRIFEQGKGETFYLGVRTGTFATKKGYTEVPGGDF